MGGPGCGGGCEVWAAAHRLSAHAGPSRARQLTWVAGELHRAQDHLAAQGQTGGGPAGGPSVGACASWLTGPLALTYLDLAATGQLRTRLRATSTSPRPSTPAAMRVRASVLRELAAALKAPGPRPRVGAGGDRGWTSRAARTRFLTWLGHQATRPVSIRTHAVATLAAASLRVGEIAALTVHQVEADGAIAVLERNPPGPGEPYNTPITLPDYTRAAVRAWLRIRAPLATSDRVAALFLTLAPARARRPSAPAGTATDAEAGGMLYTRGLPVSARSLNRTHAAAADLWLHTTEAAHWASALDVADLSLGRLALTATDPGR